MESINKINYQGQHSFFGHVQRFFSPKTKNSQDLSTATETWLLLNTLTSKLSDNDKEPTEELKNTLKGAASLVGRLQKQWFVSKQVRETIKSINVFLEADKISSSQKLPFKPLVDNQEVRQLILANHLHHKITAQHREMGYGIDYKDNQFVFSVKGYENKIDLNNLKIVMDDNYNTETGKITDLEFMADGMEIHSAKKWTELRPSYKLAEEDGKYVHIDTLSGKKEVLGEVGKNYVQIVNVKPWGWNPKGGSLFGHTWIRMVIKGELYHLGGNLQGEILNPDFMSSLSMKGKTADTTKWIEVEEDVDTYEKTKSERILIKMNTLQAILNEKEDTISEDGKNYVAELKKDYNAVRNEGGTCTSAAVYFIDKLIGKKEELLANNGRSLACRIIFNSTTKKVLNAIYTIFPKFIMKNVIHPIQVLTRGRKPTNVNM